MQLSLLFKMTARKMIVLLLLLTVIMGLPLEFPTAASGENAPRGTDSPGPAYEEDSPAAPPLATGEQETLQILKHRYRQDNTGVRARLGMCRRCEDASGCGLHRHRFRGGREQVP